MKILVTGGAGYIGSHVVRRLTENKFEVIVLDNLTTGFRESLLHNEQFIFGDVGDKAVLDKIFSTHKIEAVLHFAASIVVPESVKNPLKYYQNNTRNTLTLIDACVRHKIKNFIFSSTAAVYGVQTKGHITEDSQLQPINPYGWSKLMSEQILKDTSHANPDFTHVILRYFNVAGADPMGRIGQRSPESTLLIKVCCQVALGLKEKVEIFGNDYQTPDGTCIRDYIHVEDLAESHILALKHLLNGKPTLTANVGYGQGHSVLEVIDMVKKVSGVDFKVIHSPRRPGDPPLLVAKAERICEKLHWTPQYQDLKVIIEHAWQWEKLLANET
ncbi:MAG: UDP-glucose 4-epimerase GalE [Oligoflexia bacterium]|nr:UDP-glucose 4-epimerase GalE [Oligoflexia bacterium]